MVISEREKVLAAAVHVSAIFFPYAGPIVGYLISGSMPYVRHHARKSLIEEVLSTIIIGVLIVASLVYSLWSLHYAFDGGFDWSKVNWIGLLVKSVLTWILLSIWGVVNTVLSIRDAVKCLRGDSAWMPKSTSDFARNS